MMNSANDDKTFAPYFTDDTTFIDVADIIMSMDNALANDRVPLDELKQYPGFGAGENLPSLTEYCSKAEYAGMRASEYANYRFCTKFDYLVSFFSLSEVEIYF